MKNLLVSALSFACLVQPVGAGQWQSEENKGIFLHTIQDGTARLELVCDPEKLWIPPEFHVVVSEAGQFLQGNTVEVSTDVETLTVPLSGGSILGREPDVWNSIVAMLAQPGTVSFKAGEQELTFNIEGELTVDCNL